MLVKEQFTDERVARFFPAFYEMEVHPSVDLSGTPSVVGIEVDNPVVILARGAKNLRGKLPRLHDNLVRLAQGDKIVGIQPYSDHSPDGPHVLLLGSELDDFDIDERSAAENLFGITHSVVEVDYTSLREDTEQYLNDGPFEGHATAVMPIEAGIPNIHERLEGNTAFLVKGFVNQKGEFVRFNDRRDHARVIIDMCVMNTYMHNRVEHGLLSYDLHSSSLKYFMRANKDIAAYLNHFDNSEGSAGLDFKPHIDPSDTGSVRRFPEMTEDEVDKLHQLRNAAFRSMDTPRSELV